MWNQNPAPKIDRSYGDPGLSRKRFSKTAGTQEKCKFCGRPTYRFVGTTPVCSYCTSKVKEKWPSANREM
jgi:hypothetical protein